MKAGKDFMIDYNNLLIDNEDWLTNRIINYACEYGFAKYYSIQIDQWRVPVRQLSESLAVAAGHYGNNYPELDLDFNDSDPISKFAVSHADMHRKRGVSIQLFLGTMKYFRDSYIELIESSSLEEKNREFFLKFTIKCFDKIELACCVRWTRLTREDQINELQESAGNLLVENNKYLSLFEKINVPIIIFDEKLAISNINKAATGLFIDAKTGKLNKEHPSLLKVIDECIFIAGDKDQLLHEYDTSLKILNCERLFHIRTQKLLDLNNKFIGIIFILVDVTESKIADEELKYSEHKLKALNATKDKMFSIIGHDLRGPVGSIMSLSGLLSEKIHDFEIDKIENYIKIINSTSGQALDLLDNLLVWARMQTGSVDFNPKKIALESVLKEITYLLGYNSMIKGVNFNVLVPDDVICYADINMLKTILRNIVKNSIKFTSRGG
ncbi:MAG TPA: HAMP domain-containing sensor histidine kinase, partial [Bacteroidales bacterium]|nr:HAMP domain-containing sensor histidine kinase [Bacteroidales bacterium]